MLIWMSSPQPRLGRFLFLDRDGVINVNRSDYVKHWNEFHFYPDALEALRRLNEDEVNVILVSNQSALHRGLTTYDDFWQLHERMVSRIGEAGGAILAALYCPHRPDENCFCRKPAPGMILAASKLYTIPLGASFMVGDSVTDVQAAGQAGCHGILLDRFHGEDLPARDHNVSAACARYGSLLEAVTAMEETGYSPASCGHQHGG